MRPQDLMAGDWVMMSLPYMNEVPVYVYTVEDNHICAKDADGNMHVLDTGHFRSIPLTERILLGNGFWKMNSVDNGAEEYTAYAIDGFSFHYNEGIYYIPDTPISWETVDGLQRVLRVSNHKEKADSLNILDNLSY